MMNHDLLSSIDVISRNYFPFCVGVAEEYCEWEALNATCGHDAVVVIETASYGRMRAGRCVTSGLGPMGCSTDVTAHVDRLCSGRRHCYVDVSTIQRLTRPCPKDYKSFLEVKFACVRGT